MTNYVMCEGTGCDRKTTCKRFTQIPLPKYQAFLCMPVACKNPNDGCKWFVDNSQEKA